MISLNILINGKSKVVKFYNIFHIYKLEYNPFFINITKKTRYLIITNNEKITIHNNNDNIIIFKSTRIDISYLMNISANKKTLALTFLY